MRVTGQLHLLDRRSYNSVIIDCIACMAVYAFVFMAVYTVSYFASIDIGILF